MKRFLKQGFIFGLMVFATLQLISFLSLYSLRQSSFYKPNFVMNQVADTNFDYIILGSSTGLTTLNSIQIDSITGFSGLNLSMDDTSMGSHYLMLQHFLAMGKKTERCVLTISNYNMDLTSNVLSGNDYRFLPYVNNDYAYNYFKANEKGIVKPLTHSKYFPFLGVGYYNTELFYPSLLTIVAPEKRNRFDAKGNYMFPEAQQILKNKSFEEVLFHVNNPFYKKITAVCFQNNIELIVYHPPVYRQKSITTDTLVNFINHSDILDSADYFYDDIHVRSKGRKKATHAFAEALKRY